MGGRPQSLPFCVRDVTSQSTNIQARILELWFVLFVSIMRERVDAVEEVGKLVQRVTFDGIAMVLVHGRRQLDSQRRLHFRPGVQKAVLLAT